MANQPARVGRPPDRATASAPGKCILMGEHAVVYGAPCLSVAVDLRTEVRVTRQAGSKVAGALEPTVDGFLRSAWTHAAPDLDVDFRVRSDIPQASGLGSSGALTVAATTALFDLTAPQPPARIAQTAFLAERAAQGGGSPNDTSVATAGGTVLLAPEKHAGPGLRHLWTIVLDDRAWEVHEVDMPRLDLVIGHTGVQSRTGDQVAKVRRHVEGDPAGRASIAEMADLVWRTLDALRSGDLVSTGKLMARGQSALDRMGAGHPDLDRLIAAVTKAPGTFGAKLTGAGGGGSIVVLTARPDAASEAIREAGGRPFVLATSQDGIRRTAAAAEEAGR